MPLPSLDRERALGMRWKRSNRRGISPAATPIPVSAIRRTAWPSSAPQRDADRAVEGELQRVAQQVEDDLLPHLPVDVDGLGQRRAIHLVGQPGPLDRRPEDAGQVGRERGQVHRLVTRLHPAGLDTREVQQGVDQLAQAQPVTVNDVQFLADGLVLGRQPRAQLLQRSHDQRERRTELMADVGEERGLGPVQLGQFLGPPLLELVGHGPVDESGRLLRDQPEEGHVRLVQGAAGAGREHDHPHGLAARLTRQRKDHGLRGRRLPATHGQRGEPGAHVGQRHRLPAAQHLADRPATRARVNGAGLSSAGLLAVSASLIGARLDAGRSRRTGCPWPRAPAPGRRDGRPRPRCGHCPPGCPGPAEPRGAARP